MDGIKSEPKLFLPHGKGGEVTEWFLLGLLVGAVGLLYLHIRNSNKIDALSKRLEDFINIKPNKNKGEQI